MKRKTYLSGIFILLTITINLCAQVTIGSGIEPLTGCLLDLKEQEPATVGGVTSTKGLNLPRVRLTDLNDITKDISGVTTANADQHIGLVVYSVGVCDGVDEGVYVWEGSKWAALYSKQGSALKNRQTDSLALVTFYNSTDGTSWTNNSNWLSNQPIDTWNGVTLSSSPDGCGNRRVTKIVLSANKLTGQLPAELGNLDGLTEINLGNNELSGSIPAKLGNLANLTNLSLGANHLSGPIPAELGNLPSLTGLYVYDNNLTGPIPPKLGNLANLLYLNLGNNKLNGSIPVELGNLANLLYIHLDHNSLTDTIPVELSKLANLQHLHLHANKTLTGSIPKELSNLTNLTELMLEDNQLSGTIPSELGQLTKLTTLDLDNNQLTGSIPAALGNLMNLTVLGLSSNKLTGAIPSELGNLSKLQGSVNATPFGIAKNQLSGTLPVNFLYFANKDSDTVCPQYQSDGVTTVPSAWTNFTCP